MRSVVRRRRTIRSAGSSGSKARCGSPTWTTRCSRSTSRTTPAPASPPRDPFLETDNLAGVNYVQPSLALVFDNSLFGYVGPFYGRRYRFEFAQTLGDWRLLPGDGRLPALRPDRRARSSWPPALLYFGRIGPDARAVPDLRRQHRSDPRQHLGLVPPERVPATPTTPNTETGLRRARPAGRHPDRRRQRRAPVPDPESVLRHAGRDPAASRARCSTTSGSPGTSSSTHQVEPRGGRRSDPRPHAAPDLRRSRPGQPVRLRDRAAGLLDPAGPAGGEGPLDVQPRADVLDAGRRDGRKRPGIPSGARDCSPVFSDRRAGSLASLGLTAASYRPLRLPPFRPIVSPRDPPTHHRRRWPVGGRWPACGARARSRRSTICPRSAEDPTPSSVLRIPRERRRRRGCTACPPSSRPRGSRRTSSRRSSAPSAPTPSRASSSRSTSKRNLVTLDLETRRVRTYPRAGRATATWAPTARSTPWTPAAPSPRWCAAPRSGSGTSCRARRGELHATMTRHAARPPGRRQGPGSRSSAPTRPRSRRRCPATDDGAELLGRPRRRRRRHRGRALRDRRATATATAIGAIPVSGTAKAVMFSPSGHRLYVAHDDDGLLVLDRFSGERARRTIDLPGPAMGLRGDRFGQWLLVRPAVGRLGLGGGRRQGPAHAAPSQVRVGRRTSRPWRRPTRC